MSYKTNVVFKTYKDDYIYVSSDASEDVVITAVKDVFYNEGMGNLSGSLADTFHVHANERRIASIIGNETKCSIDSCFIWRDNLNDYRIIKLRKPRARL